MQNQLLLIKDVEDLGRSGDIVKVKPGYARNYLLPQKKAVVADKFTLRLQAKLQEERIKQAASDKKEAETIAAKLDGLIVEQAVKVDPDGHMYGSVSAADIVRLLEQEGAKVERKHVLLPHPIKELGDFTISLKLKEGVAATVGLRIFPEAGEF